MAGGDAGEARASWGSIERSRTINSFAQIILWGIGGVLWRCCARALGNYRFGRIAHRSDVRQALNISQISISTPNTYIVYLLALSPRTTLQINR